MKIRVLNPTSEVKLDEVLLAPRLNTLAGTTVGLISNGKEGTKGFFDHLTQQLYEVFGVSDVLIRVKSNYSAPAEQQIITEAASWDFAITGIGD